jgi:hypothetical protein
MDAPIDLPGPTGVGVTIFHFCQKYNTRELGYGDPSLAVPLLANN